MKRLFFCSFVTLVFPSVETLSEDIEALLKENFLLGVYNGIESNEGSGSFPLVWDAAYDKNESSLLNYSKIGMSKEESYFDSLDLEMTIETSDCDSLQAVHQSLDVTTNGYSITKIDHMDEFLALENSNVTITCKSHHKHIWTNEAGVPIYFSDEKFRYLSRIALKGINSSFVGEYTCKEEFSLETISLYLYVKSLRDIVASPNILNSDFFTSKTQTSIPCKPSNKDVQVQLLQSGLQVRNATFHPRVGFTLSLENNETGFKNYTCIFSHPIGINIFRQIRIFSPTKLKDKKSQNPDQKFRRGKLFIVTSCGVVKRIHFVLISSIVFMKFISN